MVRILAAISIAAMALVAPLASAQESASDSSKSIDELLAAFPDPLTPAQIDAILDVTEPTALRDALRRRLLEEMAVRRADTETAEPDANLLAYYSGHIRAVVEAWPQLGTALAAAFAQPQGIYPAVDPMRLLTSILLLLGVGTAATVAAGYLLSPRRQSNREAYSLSSRARVGGFGMWLLLDACQVTAFFLAAMLCYAILNPPHPLAPALLSILLYAALVVLIVERLFALLTAVDGPFSSAIAHAQQAARTIHRAAVIVTVLLVLIGASGRILLLLGMSPGNVGALLLPISAIPFAFLIAALWANRRRIRAGLEQAVSFGGEGRGVHLTAPILATVYLVAVWLIVVNAIFHQQSEIGLRALASLLLGLFGPLVALSIGSVIARYYRNDTVVAAAGGTENVEPQVMRIMRAVWIVLAFLIVYGTALIWGIDPRAHLGIGTAAFRLIFNVAIVMLLGFVVWSLIVNAIDRALRRAADEGQTTRAQRVKTLLPLLRRFLQIVLVLIIAMVLLSSMGIEIGPLLAGAGVVGIAIGLGAQQTIADILAGVFFLLEDSFRVGDYVEVGNIRGTVEGISMRSLKLRHHRGAVHTLPFGQMKSLTNYTRDWALMRLEFRVAPNTDTGLVKRIVKEIAKEISADPELGKGLIEPLKSQGIRNVEDGAIVIGVKFIATPGEQFTIRREAYRRILDAFRENGIELVGRSVVVKVESDGQIAPQAAAAAASMASQQGDEEH